MSPWLTASPRESRIAALSTGLPKVMLSFAPGRGKNFQGDERPSGMIWSKPSAERSTLDDVEARAAGDTYP